MLPLPKQHEYTCKESGIAVITVLLIVAIVAVISANTALRIYTDSKRTYFNLHDAQARQYAIGGETLAKQLLFEDFQNDMQEPPATDHLNESWRQKLPPFPQENGSIEISIVDLESRFNINNLYSKDGLINGAQTQNLTTLLRNLSMPLELSATISDWLDKDNLPKTIDSEDTYYLSLETPYRSANRAIMDTSELLAIRGINAETYKALAPYISSVNNSTGVNINTAPAEIMDMLAEEISGQEMIALRSSLKNGFSRPQELIENATFAGRKFKDNSRFTVRSQYFEVWTKATFAERTVYLRSNLFRDNASGKMYLLNRTFIRPEAALVDNPFFSDKLEQVDDLDGDGMSDNNSANANTRNNPEDATL